ncbi:MAG: iron uptake system protein EfeO [Motilibacteraceae bacterium]
MLACHALRPSRHLLALAAGLALTACSSSGAYGRGEGAPPLAVQATDSECTLDRTSTSAGTSSLNVTNSGGKVTEVYVLRPDGAIVAERENIGPGTEAELVVELPAGDYLVRCVPGMAGEGITTPFTVTASGTSAGTPTDPRVTAAISAYRSYLGQQVTATITATSSFVAAVKAGDVTQARALYAPSRAGWERIEPVAESFGDLDPKIDLREADLAEGEEWTGWHRLEKGLWVAGSTKGLTPYADQLLKDLAELQSRVPDAEITATSMANGAKELLDEVATGKVTGEEEAFSHTDLVDVQANIDGARTVVDLLGSVLKDKDPGLAAALTREFTSVQQVLDRHRDQGNSGFVGYDTVGTQDRRELAAAVDALAEPLSHLAAAVVA